MRAKVSGKNILWIFVSIKSLAIVSSQYVVAGKGAERVKNNKTTKSKTTTLKYSTAVYSTVDPDKYTKTDVKPKSSVKTEAEVENNSRGYQAAETVTTTSAPVSEQTQRGTGGIVLKTVAVGMAAIAVIAFAMTLAKKKKY